MTCGRPSPRPHFPTPGLTLLLGSILAGCGGGAPGESGARTSEAAARTSATAEHPDDPSAWSADVDSLVTWVERVFPHPHHRTDRDTWTREAERARSGLAAATAAEAILGFHRLLALAGDGHTEPAALHPALRGAWLPFLLNRYPEGWFVRTGHRDHRRLFGRRIVRIAGRPIEDVADSLRSYVSADNPFGLLDPLGSFLRNTRILAALDLVDDPAAPVPVVVTRERLAPSGAGNGSGPADGAAPRSPEDSLLTVEVRPGADAWVTPEWEDADVTIAPGPKPLYRTLDGNYAFRWLAGDRIAWVAFSEVRDAEEGESIEAFFGRVFRAVDTLPAEKLVLDLRENSGGNNDLNGPVLRGLIGAEEIDRPGRLFVLIGRDTYSAAMNLAVSLERYTHAIFVGEPTGAPPNHYGDTRTLRLPESGLEVEISELHWQNSDPRDERPWITPDLPAPVTARAFFEHRDPALEAVREFTAADSLRQAFGPPVRRWLRENQAREASWPPVWP